MHCTKLIGRLCTQGGRWNSHLELTSYSRLSHNSLDIGGDYFTSIWVTTLIKLEQYSACILVIIVAMDITSQFRKLFLQHKNMVNTLSMVVKDSTRRIVPSQQGGCIGEETNEVPHLELSHIDVKWLLLYNNMSHHPNLIETILCTKFDHNLGYEYRTLI